MKPEQIKFAKDLFDVVGSTLVDLPLAARVLVTAHGCFESGYGIANAYRRGLNAFNLTAGPAWKGAKWSDVGGDVNAKGQKITQLWRAYPTLAAGVADYWSFLGPEQNGGRYVMARAALQVGNLAEFARLLHVAGYYELAPGLYAERLDGVALAIAPFLHAGAAPSQLKPPEPNAGPSTT